MFYRKKSRYKVVVKDKVDEVLENYKDESLEDAEKSLVKDEEFQVLAKAIRELKPIYQEIIHLRYFEDLSYIEISKVTKIREGSIRVYLHRALKELNKILINDSMDFLQSNI